MVVGLGSIGMLYDYDLSKDYILSHCRAFSIHKDFILSGAVDKDKKRQSLFKTNYSGNVFSSIKQASKQLEPDIVVVSTPSGTHLEVVNEIIKYLNPSLIVCEKPLDFDIKDAKCIVERCAEKNIELFVNYIRRSDISTQKIKKMFEAEEITSPVRANVWYSKGLLNNGSHFINLLEYWLGKVTSVPYSKKYEIFSSADSNADFILEFENGIVFFQYSIESSESYNSIELFSNNGRLHYANGGEYISWQNIEIDSLLSDSFKLSNTQKIIESDMKKYQLNVVNELSNFLNKKDYYLCSGQDALDTMECIYNIFDKGNK